MSGSIAAELGERENAQSAVSGFVNGMAFYLVDNILERPTVICVVNQSSFNPYYDGIIDCFKKIRSEEGFLAFYKGNCFRYGRIIGTDARSWLQCLFTVWFQ